MTNTAWLLLDEHGVIRECGGSCEALFGHETESIVARHIGALLPELDAIRLLDNGEPNPRLRYLSRIGVRFNALNKSGERLPCELFLSSLRNVGAPPLRLVVRRVVNRSERHAVATG